MRGQGGEQLVARVDVQVVDEQAHPHAPLRSVAQGAQKLAARVVGRDQVVLNVERFLRKMQQCLACRKAFGAVRQQAKAGQAALVLRRGRLGDVGKRRAADVGERRGGRTLNVGRKHGATGEQRQRQQPGEGGFPAQCHDRAGKCACVRAHRHVIRFL